MMELTELSEDELEEEQFASENFLQSVEMYRRYKGEGREVYALGVKDQQGKILAKGVAQARKWHFGKKILRVSGGWVMDYENEQMGEVLGFLTEKVKEFAWKIGAIAVEISPNVELMTRDSDNNVVAGKDHLEVKERLEELGYKYLGEQGQPKWIYLLDLQGKTEEELFRAMRQTHRLLVKRAARRELDLREITEVERGMFMQILSETGERHQFQAPTEEYCASMKKYFGDKVKFVVVEMPVEQLTDELRNDEGVKKLMEMEAEKGKVPLAVGVFVRDVHEMVYLYGGSVGKLQKWGGACFMQWKMIVEALEEGYSRYNFYGTRPVEGNGVYHFKKGFRGRVGELVGTFILPVGWIGGLYAKRLKCHEYSQIQ